MNTMSPAAPASPVAAGDVATGNIEELDAIDQVEALDAVDEEFFALVYADPQWLRAEFDAIVAADWGSPPPEIPTPRGGAEHPARGVGPEHPRVTTPPSRGRYTIRDRGARTRSPPDPSPRRTHQPVNP